MRCIIIIIIIFGKHIPCIVTIKDSIIQVEDSKNNKGQYDHQRWKGKKENMHLDKLGKQNIIM